MKVLMIFDLIPEEQKRVIVSMTTSEYEYFSIAHNEYINNSDNELACDVIDVIQNALCEDPDYIRYCDTPKQLEYFGKWKNDTGNIDLSDVDKLICTGFIM